MYKKFKQKTRDLEAREAARRRRFLFLDYFWEEKKALCFNKPFFALLPCFSSLSPEVIFDSGG